MRRSFDIALLTVAVPVTRDTATPRAPMLIAEHGDTIYEAGLSPNHTEYREWGKK